jgi:hypothetical protein
MIRANRVKRASRALGVLLGGAIGVGASSAGPPGSAAMPAMTAPAPTAAAAAAPRLNLADVVRPEFRDAVLKVVRSPTISTRAAGEQVVCTVAVYEWLYDHPDRVALAWMRLKVPAVTITDLGGGKFAWTDENGSEVVWQTVGTFADGRVWYATGKVKGGKALPAIPIQGVIVVTYPKKVEKDGVALFVPAAQAYLHSDSRAANLALKALGPMAPKLAEDAAAQLLEFFGGIAAHVQKHPKEANDLLGPPRK